MKSSNLIYTKNTLPRKENSNMKVNILVRGVIPDIGIIGPVFNYTIDDKVAYKLVSKKIPVFDVTTRKLLNPLPPKCAVANVIAESAKQHPSVVDKIVTIVESSPTKPCYGTGAKVAETLSKSAPKETPIIEQPVVEPIVEPIDVTPTPIEEPVSTIDDVIDNPIESVESSSPVEDEESSNVTDETVSPEVSPEVSSESTVSTKSSRKKRNKK